MIINIKPLSVNQCWKGRRFKTDKYKSYELVNNVEAFLKTEFTKGSNYDEYHNVAKNFFDYLKPRIDNTIEINPLVPKTWDWFCLDRINYHGKELTIIWDKTGEKYNKGSVLMLFIEGVLSAKSNRLEKIEYSF